jgi:outer membrane lipoprotein SlyB
MAKYGQELIEPSASIGFPNMATKKPTRLTAKPNASKSDPLAAFGAAAAGTVAGELVGGVLGGPPGAIAGGVIGPAAGAGLGKEVDEKERRHPTWGDAPSAPATRHRRA